MNVAAEKTYALHELITSKISRMEESFDEKAVLAYAKKYWSVCIPVSILYLVAIYTGTKYMTSRPRFNLKTPLFCWSSFLAVFSIVGLTRCLSWLLKDVSRLDTFYLICSRDYFVSPSIGFWSCAFTISKFFELFDTAFIVLRKQKLVVLHWYHHITVLMYCFYSYSTREPGGLVYAIMNYGVHSVMYSYYAVRAYGFKPPRFIAMCITVLQILQMLIGFVTLYYLVLWQHHDDCKSTNLHLFNVAGMYGSYFLLFCNFFYHTYIKKSPQQPQPKVDVLKEHEESGDQTMSNGISSRLRKRIRRE